MSNRPTRNMTFAVLTTAIALGAGLPAAHAAEIGLGVGITDYGAEISVPIRLDSSPVTIEPEFNFTTGSSKATTSPTPTTTNVSSDKYSVGLGAFYRKSLVSSLEAYLGARFAYGETNQTIKLATSSNKINNTSYTVTPTLGAEYFITKQISFSIAAGFAVESFSDKSTSAGTTTKITGINTYTTTRAMLRVYF